MTEMATPPLGDPARLSVDGAQAELIPNAIEIDTVECPHCDTVMRKVKVETGSHVRCLNCGKRFVPQAAGAAMVRDSEESQPLAQGVRELRGADYWLLRIPALVVCAAALIFSTATAAFSFERLSRGNVDEFFLVAAYFLLWPWYGLFLFFLARSLARIDGNLMALAWRSGILREPLPPPPGSSLPYIAPLAVAGGLLPVVLLSAEGTRDFNTAFPGMIIGGILFLAAFALDDLRKFVWRQQEMGRVFAQSVNANAQHAPLIHYGTPLLIAAGIVGPLAVICIVLEEMRWRTLQAIIMPLYLSATVIMAVFSCQLLARGWDKALDWWAMAAALQNDLRGAPVYGHWRALEKYLHPLPLLKKSFCMVPAVWAVYGSAWMFAMIATAEIRTGRPGETLALVFACGFGLALALWLCVFLWRLMNWRDACEKFWKLRCADTFAKQTAVPGVRMFTTFGMILSFIQAALFVLMFLSRTFRYSAPGWDAILGFPLLVVMLHYPTMWFAMLLRQFLEIEAFTRGQREAMALAQGEAAEVQ